MSDEITIKQTGDRARNLGDHAMLVVGVSSDKKTFLPLSVNENGELVVSGGGDLPTGAATSENQENQIALGEEVRDMAFGLNGAVYISDDTKTDGSFYVIHALEDTVIATMTSSSITGTLTDIPLAAGDKIYGAVTSITLTSGKVIAYNQ